jgi:hypothetical protein
MLLRKKNAGRWDDRARGSASIQNGGHRRGGCPCLGSGHRACGRRFHSCRKQAKDRPKELAALARKFQAAETFDKQRVLAPQTGLAGQRDE